MKSRVILFSISFLILINISIATDPGMVGWWKLDNNTLDSSNYDNDGTFYGGSPNYVVGHVGFALDLDGAGDYVNIASSSFNLETHTTSFWIKPSTLGYKIAIEPVKGTTRAFGYIGLYGDGQVRHYVRNGTLSNTGKIDAQTGNLVEVDNWYHIVSIMGVEGNKLYVNGIQQTLSYLNGFPSSTESWSVIDGGNGPDNFNIGSFVYDGVGHNFFDGIIDDVRIYDRALSEEQIEQLYLYKGDDKAFAPNPYDGQRIVDPNVILSWSPSFFAADVNGHDVYFGTDFNDVNDANTTVTLGVYKGRRDANSWDPCGLEWGRWYYWRIDEVNDCNVVKGDAWCFRIRISPDFCYVDSNGTGDFSTIQAAINVALDGDTVIVAEGTYTGVGNRDIDFKGKKITIQSTEPNCPIVVASTIIDCNGTAADPHRAFYFHSGEDTNSILRGLTIKNGYADDGGGIHCNSSSPAITNCNFIDCSVENWGGGINCYKSSPLISNCTFTGNSAFEGGAITTRSYWNYLCSPHIENCHIFGNTASGSGGGINSDCLSTPIISNCMITNNFAGAYGGGGISIFQSNPTIRNCTIVDNRTDNTGGGILVWYPFENGATITNCIVWGNLAGSSSQIVLNSRSTLSINYCNIQYGFSDIFVDSSCYLNWGFGNIQVGPLFVDAVNHNYHLSEYSMCINRGDPSHISDPDETDIDGQARLMLGRVDIGADEFTFNNAPVACITDGDRTIISESPLGAIVTLDGSCSNDSDSTPGTNDDITCFDWYKVNLCNPGFEDFIGCGEMIECNLTHGEYIIILKVIDKAGAIDTDEVTIVVQDTTPPEVEIVIPKPNAVLQDGTTLTAEALDVNRVDEVYFYLREPNDGNGIQIGYEGLAATWNTGTGQWEHAFDTTVLPDGYYVILAKAVNIHGNEGWSEVVPFSIRNWAVLDLLPASKHHRAGRTMPIKFSLRIAESVDPTQPFVYNEELEVRIFDVANPANILQTSLYGDTSKDYRIDSVGELYITNFKTTKTPALYEVQIWRTSNNFLIGAFTFSTVILGKGDLTGDGKTDLDDLVVITENWLGDDTIADIAPYPKGDGTVDFRDFAALADNWFGTIE